MIEPSAINPFTLPSVALSQRKLLPECIAIYFAIDANNKIQYIGQTSNLRMRWTSHHREKLLESIGEVRLSWLEVSDKMLLAEIEAALISWFDPPINGLREVRWSPEMARTSITVPEKLLEDFKKYCDKQRRSVSAQVALLMEETLQQTNEKSE